MATLSKFNQLSNLLADGVVDFESDTFKLVLTNTAPNVANTTLSDITQLANGNGYTTGGLTVANPTTTLTGASTAVLGDAVEWTASGGSIGPFRYWVLYDDTVASPVADPLICFWDHGSAITITNGGKIKVSFNGTDSQGLILTIA